MANLHRDIDIKEMVLWNPIEKNYGCYLLKSQYALYQSYGNPPRATFEIFSSSFEKFAIFQFVNIKLSQVLTSNSLYEN